MPADFSETGPINIYKEFIRCYDENIEYRYPSCPKLVSIDYLFYMADFYQILPLSQEGLPH